MSYDKSFDSHVFLCYCSTSYPVDASRYLGMWLDLTTTHWQTWLFSSTSTYHSTDLLTTRGVAHLVVHGTSGSTSYETIPPVRLESSGGVLSTVDMVVQRRDGPRRLRDHDDDDDDDDLGSHLGYYNFLNSDCLRLLPDSVAAAILTQALLRLSPRR